jgi:hypothetical protein
VLNNDNCKLTNIDEIFTLSNGGARMSGKRWFGGRTPAEAGVSLVQSLFSPIFGSSSPATPMAAAHVAILSDSDAGSDASWTASLDRGDGLPPFLLSINMVAGSCSAMKFEARFEARARREGVDSIRQEI